MCGLSRFTGERRFWRKAWMAERTGIRPYMLLCLLCFALYAPGLAAIPPLDRDEARFAQATRQMLETGDFVRVRFQEESRNKKPVGIYWLQAVAVSAFSSPESTAIWPYRLPSALGAATAVLLTFSFGTRLLGSPQAGLVAPVLTATALGVVVEAHLAKTDAALLAAVVAGQGALGRVYVGTRGGWRISCSVPLVFWCAEGVAILLKGPPGPLLALLTVTCLSVADRDRRSLYIRRGLERPAAEAGRRTRIAWRAPWISPGAGDRMFLARVALCHSSNPMGLAAASRASAALSARMARSGLDFFRARADQATALRAPPLSGDSAARWWCVGRRVRPAPGGLGTILRPRSKAHLGSGHDRTRYGTGRTTRPFRRNSFAGGQRCGALARRFGVVATVPGMPANDRCRSCRRACRYLCGSCGDRGGARAQFIMAQPIGG